MNEHPSFPPQKPAVWNWYIAYCVAMALIYLACAAMGITLLAVDPQLLEMEPMEAKIQGAVLLAVGAVFTVPFAIAPLMPRKPWSWIYGLVLICIGLTSCCCMIASIPMLIYWLKPETKAFFGKA